MELLLGVIGLVFFLIVMGMLFDFSGLPKIAPDSGSAINGIIWALIILVVLFVIYYFIKDIRNRKKKQLEEKHAVALRSAIMGDDISKAIVAKASFSFKCPDCAANIPVKTGEEIKALCPFCHASLPEAEEMIIQLQKDEEEKRKLQLEVERLHQHEREVELQHKQEIMKNKTERQNNIRDNLPAVLGIIAVILMFLLVFVFLIIK